MIKYKPDEWSLQSEYTVKTQREAVSHRRQQHMQAYRTDAFLIALFLLCDWLAHSLSVWVCASEACGCWGFSSSQSKCTTRHWYRLKREQHLWRVIQPKFKTTDKKSSHKQVFFFFRSETCFPFFSIWHSWLYIDYHMWSGINKDETQKHPHYTTCLGAQHIVFKVGMVVILIYLFIMYIFGLVLLRFKVKDYEKIKETVHPKIEI